MPRHALVRACLLWSLTLASCGGTAVVEDGGGGAGGAGATTGATTSATTGASSSTATGGALCSSHDQCPGGVCVFATGQCAPACGDDLCPSCGPGLTCSPCATSSCPGCDDCRGACLPRSEGTCDADDPCADGQVCIWSWGYCADACAGPMDCDAFSACDECATSSCCGCADCVSACIGQE